MLFNIFLMCYHFVSFMLSNISCITSTRVCLHCFVLAGIRRCNEEFCDNSGLCTVVASNGQEQLVDCQCFEGFSGDTCQNISELLNTLRFQWSAKAIPTLGYWGFLKKNKRGMLERMYLWGCLQSVYRTQGYTAQACFAVPLPYLNNLVWWCHIVVRPLASHYVSPPATTHTFVVVVVVNSCSFTLFCHWKKKQQQQQQQQEAVMKGSCAV